MAESSWQKKKVTNILQSLAAAYLANRQYENAVEKFLQLKALGDEEPATCLGLAGAFLGLKQTTPDALEAYRRFCDLFPEDGELISNIAELLLVERVRSDEALHIYRSALAFHPPIERELHLVLLEAFEQRGDLALALQAARSAALLPGGDLHAVRKLVALSWRQKRFDELLQELMMLAEQPSLYNETRRYTALTLAYRAVHNGAMLISKELKVVKDVLAQLQPAVTIVQVREYCLLRLAVARSERSPAVLAEQNASENAEIPASGDFFKSSRENAPTQEEASLFPNLFDIADDGENDAGHVAVEDDFTESLSEYFQDGKAKAVMVLSARLPLPLLGEQSLPAAASDFVRRSHDLMQSHLTQIRRFDDGLIAVAESANELLEVATNLLRKIPPDSTPGSQDSLHPVVIIHAMSDDDADQSLGALSLLHTALHFIGTMPASPSEGRETTAPSIKLLATSASLDAMDDQNTIIVSKRRRMRVGMHEPEVEVNEIVWQDPFAQRANLRPVQVGRFSIAYRIYSTDIFSTFTVRDNTLGVAAIMKSLSPLRAVDFDEKELMQAIRRIGRLTHPGLALIHDVGKHEGVFYFVREFVEGHSLADQQSFESVRSVGKILTLGLQACRALQYAHREGILHLNLRPSNFWITPEGKVKLTDFSLPGLYDADYATDRERHYIAPELRESSSTSPASDVYSLAALLFLMVSHLPTSIADDDFFAPLNFSPEQKVPDALKEILFAAVAHDPLARPQSIADFERQLRQCQSLLPPSVMSM